MGLFNAKSLLSVLFAFTSYPATTRAGLLTFIGELIQGDGLPILDYPLAEMKTKTPSPECAYINKGSRLCCESTFDGDIPLLLELAPVIGYHLNPNSVNGIFCKKDMQCLRGADLCCQVDAFPQVIPTLLNLAMYCQNAPKNTPSSTIPY